MKINCNKTKLMIFNPARTKDFHPRFLMNGNELEMTEKTNILGLILRSDFSWNSNTEYIVRRANKKHWCLRRLKNFETEIEDSLEVYLIFIIASASGDESPAKYSEMSAILGVLGLICPQYPFLCPPPPKKKEIK